MTNSPNIPEDLAKATAEEIADALESAALGMVPSLPIAMEAARRLRELAEGMGLPEHPREPAVAKAASDDAQATSQADDPKARARKLAAARQARWRLRNAPASRVTIGSVTGTASSVTSERYALREGGLGGSSSDSEKPSFGEEEGEKAPTTPLQTPADRNAPSRSVTLDQRYASRSELDQRYASRSDAPPGIFATGEALSSMSDIRFGPGRGKAAPSKDPATVPIPPELDSPEFTTARDDWFADRRDRRHTVTVRAWMSHLRTLLEIAAAAGGGEKGREAAIEAIRTSIDRGWRSVFPPGQTPAKGPPGLRPETTRPNTPAQRGVRRVSI